MANRLYGSYALALALSQALWVLPGAREAVAHPSGDPSCYLPPYSLISSAHASRTTSQPGRLLPLRSSRSSPGRNSLP